MLKLILVCVVAFYLLTPTHAKHYTPLELEVLVKSIPLKKQIALLHGIIQFGNYTGKARSKNLMTQSHLSG